MHRSRVIWHGFQAELRATAERYSELERALASQSGSLASLIASHSHIAHSRLRSLRQDIVGSRARPLSPAALPLGKSRVHECVRRFVRNDADALTVAALILELRAGDCALQTGDLWALPDCLSLSVIDEICTLARSSTHVTSTQEHRIAVLFALLAELQNVHWVEIMPVVSSLDPTLSKDPTGDYARMDPATQDTYRQAIAALARKARQSESEIARAALALARQAEGPPECTHIGYYLLGPGKMRLRQALRLPRHRWPTPRWGGSTRFMLWCLVVALACGAGLFTAFVLDKSLAGSMILAARLAVACALTLVVSAVIAWSCKSMAVAVVRPKKTPLLDYSKAVPSRAKTLVVMPCLLRTDADPARLKERIQQQFLRNRVANVHFALLTDWADSDHAVTDEDHVLLDLAVEAINDLNRQYVCPGSGVLLLHRRRYWSSSEQVWMGRGRKHGKLVDLNHLLATGDRSAFMCVAGDQLGLAKVKYVITIDDDTELSYGAATRLIAAIDHPLCRPRLSVDAKRVCYGHALLQPAVSALSLRANASRYETLAASGGGLKVYQSPVPGFYSDFLHCGSYIGKGIYDVACAQVLLPQYINQDVVLSHDLVEGGLLRAAAMSDTEIFEAAPRSYRSEMLRQHRWIRGDTQNVLWLLCDPHSRRGIGAVTSWRMLESLLTHLLEPALLVLALAGFASFDDAWFAALVIAFVFGPPCLRAVARVFRLFGNPLQVAGGQSLELAWRDFQSAWLRLSSLPHRAMVSLQAIAVAGYRFSVSRTRLLDWPTFQQTNQGETGRTMLPLFLANLASALVALSLAYTSGSPFGMAEIVLVAAWLTAPILMAALAIQPVRQAPEDSAELRLLAWRTWSFFRRAFAVSGHGLVPDNVQALHVDRRTSPTDIGLSLVSLVAAQRLGLVSRADALRLASRVVTSVARLRKLRGHLYNWYDIDSLEVLGTARISSADSANFIASIIVLTQWLRESSPECESQIIARTYHDILTHLEADRLTSQSAMGLEALARLAVGESLEASDLSALIERLEVSDSSSEYVNALSEGLRQCASALVDNDCGRKVEATIKQCEALAAADFGHFLEARSGLLRIEWQNDAPAAGFAMYDLLASEARLATYLGVAVAQLPVESWQRLGRTKILTGQGPCLLSWSGSLFEHLFAELFIPAPCGSLLDISCQNALSTAIAEGAGGFWGRSECAYQDFKGCVSYGPVGVDELALSASAAHIDAVAPYAGLLALPRAPDQTKLLIRAYAGIGAVGTSGLFESVSRCRSHREDAPSILRRCYSHHQAMVLASIANYLYGAIPDLFLRDGRMRAAALLLREVWPEHSVIVRLRSGAGR